MKRWIVLCLSLWCATAHAQTYPSPTYQNVTVNGAAVMAGSGVGLAVTNAATIGDTLGVAGAVTLGTQTVAAGQLILSASGTGRVMLQGPAHASFLNALTVPGVTDTLAVLGTAQTFTADQIFSGSGTGLSVTTGAALSGGGTLGGTFAGTPTFSGALTLSGTPSFTNGASLGTGTYSGAATFSGDITMSGAGTGLSVTNGLVVSGRIENANGSASVPAYTFANDLTTGAYLPAAGELGFAAAGALVGDYGATNAGDWTFAKPAVLSGSGTGLTVTNAMTVGGVATFSATGSGGTILGGSGETLVISPGSTNQNIQFGAGSFGVGNIGTFTFSSLGNVGDGATGHKATFNNLLQAPFYRTPGLTYTISGSTFPAVSNLVVNYAGSYTGSSPVAANAMTISTDTLDASGSSAGNPPAVLSISDNPATGAKGGRITFLPAINVINGTITDGSGPSFEPVYSQAQASAACSGCKLYGHAAQAVLHSGATGWAYVNGGGEDDLAMATGSTVQVAELHSFVLLSGNTTAATIENDGLLIAAQVGATPTLNNPVIIGGSFGPWPAASTSTLVGTIKQTACGGNNLTCAFPPELATYGTDWSNVNFSQQSGYGFRSPGFAVDGSGNGWFANGLTIAAVASTGYKIDVPNVQVVTSVAVATAGSPTVSAGSSAGNYYPGDGLLGTSTPTPGQYKITHTKVLSAAVTAGGTGGTPGTQTVTGTTGTGTPFQASVTVSGGGAITAVLSISVAGDYTVNPTNLNAEPVTGASLTGASLSVGVGALTVSTLVGGVFNSCPGAGGITPTGGSGTGLTLTPSCTAESTLQLQPSGGVIQPGSGAWTANASTATALTSLGPTGSHSTVQEWLTFTDASGTVRYIPAF